jgi:superfamily I DNA/RNA helicase/RecB family exonuclease
VVIAGFEVGAASAPVASTAPLDAAQQAVLELPDAASAVVIGAPGTGKTTTTVELVADRVLGRGWSADSVVVLTPSRASATRLRDRLSRRLAVPTNGPLARTANSLAFEIVSNAAKIAGAPVPRLVTGGEQDADLADLLAGHLEQGTGPFWPEFLGPEVRGLRAFRTELREIMSRAVEYGVASDRLRALGHSTGHDEWAAVADFIDEYGEVISQSRPSQFTSAEFLAFAVEAISRGEAGERIDRLRLVVADDLQEATESTWSLLRALAARGVAVVGFGDPDVASNAFRGGRPDAVGRFAAELGRPDAATLLLTTSYRQGPALRSLSSAVTGRIGAAGAGRQRSATAGGRDGDRPIATIAAESPARQWAAISRQLREAHLSRGVRWSDMAVVVRSSAQIPHLRRALALAEVPARASVGSTALRDDRAARALLDLVDTGIGRAELDITGAVALLTGPFGGLDRLGLRKLRLALRAEELGGGGNRSADELLVEALAAPGRFVTIDHRVGRRAEKLASMLANLRTRYDAGDTIEELLWTAWQASGLAKTWYEDALSAGVTSAEANANLDGALALFTAAKRFVERNPGGGARTFLEEVLDADVPEDTLSPQPLDEAVLVTTPPGVVGLEFDTVVVASLQDGSWPNLRIRGSLLAPQELVRIVTGADAADLDERRLVLSDELRLFALAVSRAREAVILSAVVNDDESPSVFLNLIPAEAPAIDTTNLAPLSLRGMTGRLRRELARPDRSEGERRAAASGLARLAAEGVPGADPEEWQGLIPISTDAPIYLDDERVPVSPSRLARFEESPLDWFLETVAGSQSSTAMGMGTILHWAMETAASPDLDALWLAVEERWSELMFESPWMAESQKRAARVLAAGIAEYLADFARDGKQLVGAESRFALDIDRAIVNGSIDRVERDSEGNVMIVDLKTGNPVTRQPEIDEHPQLAAYQLAYAEGVLDEYLAELGDHRPGGAKLLFVKKGVRGKLYREGVQQAMSDEQLEAFRARIRLVADGMAAASFAGALDLETWSPGGTSPLELHRVRAVSSD